MKEHNIKKLISELSRLLEEKRSIPFPHEGCRTLLQEVGGEYDLFIPHLDLYFINIAGYCSAVKKMETWPVEKIEKALVELKEKFFELYPQYAVLEPLITQSKIPDLHRALFIYEKIRINLLALLSTLHRTSQRT